MHIPILAWIIFAVFIGVVGILSVSFIRYFFDKREREYMFTSIVVCLALSVTMLTLVLIPIDIYNVSSTRDASGNVRLTPSEIDTRMTGVKNLYYVLYGLILFFVFIAIPFTFFYFEEGDPDTTTGERMLGACRFSVALTIALIVLLVIGVLINGQRPHLSDPSAQAAVDALLDSEDKGEASVGFTMACVSLLGYVCLVVYGGYGMASMPVRMVMGRIALSKEDEDVSQSLLNTRERARAIQAKYISGRRITKKDQRALDTLKRTERQLRRRQTRLDRSKNSLWERMLRCLRPMELVFGVFFVLLSIFLILCLLLTGFDRALHSMCGYDCGFTLSHPRIYNPFDKLMVVLSRVFPVDFIFVMAVMAYFFLTAIAGLVRLGIRFFCWTLYRIRHHNTVPQGMLLGSALLMMMIMALNIMFLTISPQYANYGSQVYRTADGGTKHCSFDAPVNASCTMSEIGTYVNRISIKFPFFGAFFFFANFAFVGVYLLGILYSFLRGRGYHSMGYGQLSSSSSDDFW